MEKSYTASAIRKRKWREENPERYLKSNRENAWKILGIDIEKANSLRDTIKQCQICEGTFKLSVDHCHSSNKIRGIICNQCNLALGMFKDNSARFRKAADYIDYHSNLVYTRG